MAAKIDPTATEKEVFRKHRQLSNYERWAIRASAVVAADVEVVVAAVVADEKRKQRMRRSWFVIGSCGGGGQHECLKVFIEFGNVGIRQHIYNTF